MAAQILGSYRDALMKGLSLNLLSVDLKIVLVSSAHVANDAVGGDAFLADIAPTARVAYTPVLSGVQIVSGVLKADNPPILDTGGGAQSTQAYLFVNTGDPATSRLLVRESNANLTLDGTDDQITINAAGLLQL